MEPSSPLRRLYVGDRKRKSDSPLPRVSGTKKLKADKLSKISPTKSAFRGTKRNKRECHTVLREDVGDAEFERFYRTLLESGTQFRREWVNCGEHEHVSGLTINISDLVWLANETTRLLSILNESETEEEGGETGSDTIATPGRDD